MIVAQDSGNRKQRPFSHFFRHERFLRLVDQCYTCGLTGDRGCCTLCALICHNGHDVSYARHSSFFCDCGAEQSNPDASKKVRCRCLAPLSSSDIEQVVKSHVTRTSACLSTSPNFTDFISLDKCSDLLKVSYEHDSLSALHGLLDVARKSDWGNLLFKQMAIEFHLWKSSANTISARISPNAIDSYSRFSGALLQGTERKTCFENATKCFSRRHCSFREGSVQMNLSSIKRTYLTEKNLARQALEADSRGRVMVGEANAVLFCNGLAIINLSEAKSSLLRQSACILKVVPIYFEIIGIRLSRANECLLAVWGSHDITVLEMNNTLSNCDRRFDLVPELKDPAYQIVY